MEKTEDSDAFFKAEHKHNNYKNSVSHYYTCFNQSLISLVGNHQLVVFRVFCCGITCLLVANRFATYAIDL